MPSSSRSNICPLSRRLLSSFLQYKAARWFGLHQSQENWKVAWARIFQETANGLSTSPGGNQEFGAQNVFPLMRLPDHIRRIILRHVIDSDPIVYPKRDSESDRRKGPWRVMPEIKRANPSRDLSILYTCQKLWEDSWRAIQDHNYIVMPFDPTAEYFLLRERQQNFLLV